MQAAADLVREVRRGRFFDQLLVRGLLHRAVAFADVHHVAERVAQDLHFDVPRLLDELFQIEPAVFEIGFGFGLRGGEGVLEFVGPVDRAHALAAAARGRLEHHGIPDLARRGQRFGGRNEDAGAGGGGHFGFLHDGFGRGLIAHLLDHRGCGADEGQPMIGADLREARVLGQEAVTRMHRVGARNQRGRNDVGDVEVRARARAGTDAVRFVGAGDVQRGAVRFGKDGDRFGAGLVRGAVDPQRDLAAVRNQNLLEHYDASSSANSGCPYSTAWPSPT